MTSPRRHTVLVCAALVILTVAVYWQATGFDFVIIDDNDYAKENPHIRTGITLENLKWVTYASVGANWHPVTVLSHQLDNTLYGSKAGMHHLTSVVIHVVNALLLFGLLLRVTNKTPSSNALARGHEAPEKLQDPKTFWASAIVAAFFALHPLRAESVAWISERKDVLSGFFFLLTLWSYAFYSKHNLEDKARGKAIVWYVASLGCFAFGLMSKAMVVTVPFVLILLDYWPLRRIREFNARTLMGNVVEKIPFFALAVAFSLITFFVQKHSGTVIGLSTFPMSARIANATVSYSRYLGKTFWPYHLAAFYPSHPWEPWQVAGAALVFVLISTIAFLNIKKRPYLFVGWFIFAGMLVPVLGISQVGTQSMADRYTYLPHMGLFVALVWLAFDVFRKLKPATFAIGGSLFALLLVPVTYAQVGMWRDSETMIQTTLNRTGNNSECHLFLGAVNQKKGKLDEAELQYKEAVRLNPGALEALCGLGNIYDKRGKLDAAIEQYNLALKQSPTFALAHHCLADVYVKLGKTDDAIAHYTAALEGHPDIAETHMQLALLLEGKHDAANAINHLHEAVRLRPDWTDALNNLAWALATQRDEKVRNGDEAARLAAQAVSLTHNNDPGALDTLAAALAEQGKFPDAVRAATTAMEKARAMGDTNLYAEIAGRAKLYESQRAYRE
jgi:protein O-mannosyl-transferase